METLAQGMGMGFAAGTLVGPFQTFLFLQTLQYGATHAGRLVVAPLLSDAPIIAIVLFLLGQANDTLLRFISFAGGCFVFYLAFTIWRQLRAGGFQLEVDNPATYEYPTTRQAMWQAVTINALGPGPWLFWGTVTGPLVIEAWREAPPNAITFVIGFYGTFLSIMWIEVLVFHQARRLGAKVVNILLWGGMFFLAGFAGLLWMRAL